MNTFTVFSLLCLFASQGFANEVYKKIYTATDSEKLIVFVHGYWGNPTETWSNESFYWPQALHEDIKANVYVAEFETGICDGEDIKTISKKIFGELDSIYKNNFKNVTFIGHSMGGLVIRKLLIDNFDYFKEKFSSNETILNFIHLDTPNLGSNVAELTKFCSKQAKDLIVNSRFLDDLNEDWRSKFLQRESSQFFYFFTVYANESGVVTKNSAVEFGQKKEMFEGGHRQIAKPSNKEDRIYKLTRGQITDQNPWLLVSKTSRDEEEKANRKFRNLMAYSEQKDPVLVKALIDLSLSNKKLDDFKSELRNLVNTSMNQTKFMDNPLTSNKELLLQFQTSGEPYKTPSLDVPRQPNKSYQNKMKLPKPDSEKKIPESTNQNFEKNHQLKSPSN